MVDAQFVEDRYTDSDERNRAEIEEINRRTADRAAHLTAPKSKAQRMSDRALAIQAAGAKIEHGGYVVLDEFSKFTPNGETISVKVKRITPQELLAGDFLPVTARKMVAYFVELGTKATAGERSRVGLELASGQDVVDNVFDGDVLEAATAYESLMDAVCVAAVRDPDIHLYINEKAKGDDQFGLVVSRIPLPDREKIAAWALGSEEKAAQAVAPFLRGPAHVDNTVPTVEGRDGEAQRADQV